MTRLFKGKRLQFLVSDGEKEMFDQLCKRFSCNSSELFREWIRNNHAKTFPAYRISNQISEPEENLTQEQACERFSGKVGKDEAFNEVCIFTSPNGSSIMRVPMSMPERFKAAAVRMGIIK